MVTLPHIFIAKELPSSTMRASRSSNMHKREALMVLEGNSFAMKICGSVTIYSMIW
jgi:hypothetical protein